MSEQAPIAGQVPLSAFRIWRTAKAGRVAEDFRDGVDRDMLLRLPAADTANFARPPPHQ